jgi:membrane protease YdiL (CAAX protease family)
MTVVSRRIESFVGFSLLALGMITAGSLVWGALLYANLRSTPDVPWALPALVALLWAAWRYLGGRGWPASTSSTRRTLLRAHRVTRAAFLWSMVAGLLAVGALAGLWIVTVRLFALPPNLLLPGRFTASPLLTAAVVVGASLLAPVIEESAVRGYLQSVLERDFSPVTAVLLASVVFALAHVPQGAAGPKLALYFVAGVTFGSLAYLNDSILPVIPVHVCADLIFFAFVWPYDGARIPIAHGGPDTWFWLHVLQIVVCGGLSLAAFRRLARPARDQASARSRFSIASSISSGLL